MTNYIQVLTTTPTKQAAQAIADALLSARLAACVQIVGPIESHYWWQGKIEVAEEWQCLAKSRLDLFVQLEATIRGQHPYEVPEIIATRINAATAAYLDWLEKELREKDEG